MAEAKKIEETINRLLEAIAELTKRVEELEKLVKFHEQVRRR